MILEGQKIKINEGDDSPEFIEIVNKIMSMLIFQYSVKEVVFVKVKNWFDHKWLNYSGKSVVKFDFGGLKEFEDRNNSALEDQWRNKVSIPPFNPNRIVYSKFFTKQDTGNEKIKKKIHRYRSSNDNIHNRINDYTSDGLVLWFSSNTFRNQRGSLMVYRVQDDQVFTWYATIENQNGWKITYSKGINLSELKAYVI